MRNVSTITAVIRTMFQTKLKEGFTLLEILIILVVLGILSWAVIPQLTEATAFGDHQEQALEGILISLRSQLELYRVEHMDEYPCGNPAEPVLPDEFVKRITSKTNSDHSGHGIFGPYLMQFPFNPFNGLNDVRYGSDPGANQAGWCFDLSTGVIYADDSKSGPDGTRHSQY